MMKHFLLALSFTFVLTLQVISAADFPVDGSVGPSRSSLVSRISAPSMTMTEILRSFPAAALGSASRSMIIGSKDTRLTGDDAHSTTVIGDSSGLVAAGANADGMAIQEKPASAGDGGSKMKGVGNESPNATVRWSYRYYSDSDNNILNRYGAGFSADGERWNLTVDSQYLSAKDATRSSEAVLGRLGARANVTPILGLSASVGAITMNGRDCDTSLIGHIKADVNVLLGTATAYIAREPLPETAALIDNDIRYTAFGFSTTQKPKEQLSVSTSYVYRRYSDHNFAHDAQISIAAVFAKKPAAAVGYGFRYFDFDRESRSGYFDPQDFMSHQLFLTLSGEIGRAYYFVQPFAGYQSYRRFGQDNDEFYGGGLGSVGVRLTRHVTLELNIEGGNYALGTASGFSYYLIGTRIEASF